ncbi:MAG: VCBS repeat-containing protein, partial [Candidatus Bipolaricaulota bacterium]|nr:VCBS repeat-containing protein [Candidatus Bipolaricaulota bacterium]
MLIAKEAFPGTKMVSPGSEKFYAVSGNGTLFTRASIPSFTDIQEGTNGIALADLNRDGWMDIIATYTPPMGSAGSSQDKLRVFINQGNLRFKEHAIKITNQKFAPSEFGKRAQIPNLVDFNRDGFLDLYITRSAPMNAGQFIPGRPIIGNSLLVSQGAWDTFVDVSEKMGVRNEVGYNRQSSIGDVNKDGWLDIAVGCDNIGNAMGGLPHSRLYIFQ